MKTKDIMTTPVISVTPETSVPEVARLLLGRHISAVPVLDAGGHLVGIVSEGDFLRRAEEPGRWHGSWWLRLIAEPADGAAEYVKTHGRFVRDVMTRDVTTVTEETPIGETAYLLETKRIKRVPVLRGSQVVGIVSRADILRGVAARQEPEPVAASTVADETIRRQVLEEIENAEWTPTYALSVIVSNGIVQIWGVIEANGQRDALRVLAEGVPGVRRTEINVGTIPAYAWAE
jgi:CBS-domain-containing membrane protein